MPKNTAGGKKKPLKNKKGKSRGRRALMASSGEGRAVGAVVAAAGGLFESGVAQDASVLPESDAKRGYKMRWVWDDEICRRCHAIVPDAARARIRAMTIEGSDDVIRGRGRGRGRDRDRRRATTVSDGETCRRRRPRRAAGKRSTCRRRRRRRRVRTKTRSPR